MPISKMQAFSLIRRFWQNWYELCIIAEPKHVCFVATWLIALTQNTFLVIMMNCKKINGFLCCNQLTQILKKLTFYENCFTVVRCSAAQASRTRVEIFLSSQGWCLFSKILATTINLVFLQNYTCYELTTWPS